MPRQRSTIGPSRNRSQPQRMPPHIPFAVRLGAGTAGLILLAALVIVLVPLTPLTHGIAGATGWLLFVLCAGAMLMWAGGGRSRFARTEQARSMELGSVAWLVVFAVALVGSMFFVYDDCGSVAIFQASFECDDDLGEGTHFVLGITLVALPSAFRAWIIERWWSRNAGWPPFR